MAQHPAWGGSKGKEFISQQNACTSRFIKTPYTLCPYYLGGTMSLMPLISVPPVCPNPLSLSGYSLSFCLFLSFYLSPLPALFCPSISTIFTSILSLCLPFSVTSCSPLLHNTRAVSLLQTFHFAATGLDLSAAPRSIF